MQKMSTTYNKSKEIKKKTVCPLHHPALYQGEKKTVLKDDDI